MFEVTKHGKYWKQQVCPKCGCEFSYTTNELRYEGCENPFLPQTTYHYTLPCPECRGKIKIEEHIKRH